MSDSRGMARIRQAAGAWVEAVEEWAAHLRAGGRSPATIKIRRYYVERAGRDSSSGTR